MLDFIQGSLDTLQIQSEAMEAEIIQMENSAKKKGLDKAQLDRKRHLEGIMDSSAWHVNNLEKVLRFLRNGQLTVQQVEDIKYGIEDYVERNQDPDFAGADMELYEELGIEGLGEMEDEEEEEEESITGSPVHAAVTPKEGEKKGPETPTQPVVTPKAEAPKPSAREKKKAEKEAAAKARKEAEEREKEAQAKLRERQREEEQSAIERSREAREKAAKLASQSNGMGAMPTVQADPSKDEIKTKAPEIQTMTHGVQQALTGSVAPAQMMLAMVTA